MMSTKKRKIALYGLLTAAALLIGNITYNIINPEYQGLKPYSEPTTPFGTKAPEYSIMEFPKIFEAKSKDTGTTLNLSSRDTIIFRSVVDDLSIAKLQESLINKSRKLAPNDTIYLVLDTPGGSIPAGQKLVDTVHSIPQKVKTITTFAASMGFYFVQALGERLITPHGVLMAHRAKISGVGGQIPGEFNVQASFLGRMVNEMELQNAARINVPLRQYQETVRDEYWVTGAEAVAQNAADRVVNISCNDSLMGTTVENIQVFIFNVAVTYSNCPAISGPLKIEVGGNMLLTREAEERLNAILFNRADVARNMSY